MEDQSAGKLLWVSPTTIPVNRLVYVERQTLPYRQACSCALCRTSRTDGEKLKADCQPTEI